MNPLSSVHVKLTSGEILPIDNDGTYDLLAYTNSNYYFIHRKHSMDLEFIAIPENNIQFLRVEPFKDNHNSSKATGSSPHIKDRAKP